MPGRDGGSRHHTCCLARVRISYLLYSYLVYSYLLYARVVWFAAIVESTSC